jgi:hypothetical protein
MGTDLKSVPIEIGICPHFTIKKETGETDLKSVPDNPDERFPKSR